MIINTAYSAYTGICIHVYRLPKYITQYVLCINIHICTWVNLNAHTYAKTYICIHPHQKFELNIKFVHIYISLSIEYQQILNTQNRTFSKTPIRAYKHILYMYIQMYIHTCNTLQLLYVSFSKCYTDSIFDYFHYDYLFWKCHFRYKKLI